MRLTAVRLGHGGSLLKDLNLLKIRKKPKADSLLLAQNGTHVHSAFDKSERWGEHFAQVSNVEVEVSERVLSSVLETALVSPPTAAINDHL